MGNSVRVDSSLALRQLRKLGAEAKKEIKASNKEAAQVVVEAAAPDVPRRTGRAANTLKAFGTQKEGRAQAGGRAAPYVPALHWGRKKGGVIIGRPFLVNATRRSLDKVHDVREKALQRALDKLGG